MKNQFSTHIIDNVLRKKIFQREELRQDTIIKVKVALKDLSKDILFKEAYIFGSVLRPNKFENSSDIDIGFVGLEDGDFFRTLAILSRKLENNVDIIQLEDHRFKDKIVREGIKWTKKE